MNFSQEIFMRTKKNRIFLYSEYNILLNNKFNGGKVGNINIKKY